MACPSHQGYSFQLTATPGWEIVPVLDEVNNNIYFLNHSWSRANAQFRFSRDSAPRMELVSIREISADKEIFCNYW